MKQLIIDQIYKALYHYVRTVESVHYTGAGQFDLSYALNSPFIEDHRKDDIAKIVEILEEREGAQSYSRHVFNRLHAYFNKTQKRGPLGRSRLRKAIYSVIQSNDPDFHLKYISKKITDINNDEAVDGDGYVSVREIVSQSIDDNHALKRQLKQYKEESERSMEVAANLSSTIEEMRRKNEQLEAQMQQLQQMFASVMSTSPAQFSQVPSSVESSDASSFGGFGSYGSMFGSGRS